MFILRLPYALMTGVIVGASALIPVMGAYIGAIVGAFLIVTISPLKAVEFVVYLAILQQIEGNVIYPRVVGGSIACRASGCSQQSPSAAVCSVSRACSSAYRSPRRSTNGSGWT